MLLVDRLLLLLLLLMLILLLLLLLLVLLLWLRLLKVGRVREISGVVRKRAGRLCNGRIARIEVLLLWEKAVV